MLKYYDILTQILKINYQESMLLSGIACNLCHFHLTFNKLSFRPGDVAYKEIATREENAERSAGSSFFKSTVSSVSRSVHYSTYSLASIQLLILSTVYSSTAFFLSAILAPSSKLLI